MLTYFWEGLKPSILAKLKHQNLERESFDPMIKTTVDIKVKAALWPPSSVKEMNQNCLRDSQSANSTVIKSQSSIIKDSRIKRPKVQDTES